MRSLRPLAVLLLMLCASALAAWLRPTQGVAEHGPQAHLEAAVPGQFAGWTTDASEMPIPLAPEVQAMLARTYDEILERTYVDAGGRRIMVSMVYVRQAEQNQIHRPEVCYPAQGFVLEGEPHAATLATPAGPITATRLVARRGLRVEPITYWVLVGGEQTTFGMPMRLLQVRLGLRGIIPDSVLVRVSSIGRDVPAEFAAQDRFIGDLVAGAGPEHRLILAGAGAVAQSQRRP